MLTLAHVPCQTSWHPEKEKQWEKYISFTCTFYWVVHNKNTHHPDSSLISHIQSTRPYFVCIFSFLKLLYLFIYWRHPAAWGISIPSPGIEPAPPAVEAQSLNLCTTREAPVCVSSHSTHLLTSYKLNVQICLCYFLSSHPHHLH